MGLAESNQLGTTTQLVVATQTLVLGTEVGIYPWQLLITESHCFTLIVCLLAGLLMGNLSVL